LVFTSPNYTATQGISTASPSGKTLQTVDNGGYIQDGAGGGGLNISSPPAGDGDFAGMTIYQDPTPWDTASLTTPSPNNNTYSQVWDGNSSKTGWTLSGGVYLPNAVFTFNGAVDKASNGYDCFSMVAAQITNNGGNGSSIFAASMANPLAQCGLQGTNVTKVAGYRFALVG
jgi:hypothetical protein